MNRCNNCGNYFESKTGICPFCGANNKAPHIGEPPKPKKKSKKLIVKKKKNTFKTLLKFMAVAFVVVAIVILWPIMFPKYANNPTIDYGNDSLPTIFNFAGKIKGVKQSKVDSGEFKTISLKYPANTIDAKTMESYVDQLKKMGYLQFNNGTQNKGLGFARKANDPGYVNIIDINGSTDRGLTMTFRKVEGLLDEYAVGTTQRIGGQMIGYIDVPTYFVERERKDNYLVVEDPNKTSSITIRSGGERSLENYTNKLMIQLEQFKRKGLISDFYTEPMSMDQDIPGSMIYYLYKPNKVYFQHFIFYNEATRRIYHLTFTSITNHSKVNDLIFTYSLKFNNIDAPHPEYKRR